MAAKRQGKYDKLFIDRPLTTVHARQPSPCEEYYYFTPYRSGLHPVNIRGAPPSLVTLDGSKIIAFLAGAVQIASVKKE